MVMMVQSCFIKYFMMYVVKNIFTQCCIHYQNSDDNALCIHKQSFEKEQYNGCTKLTASNVNNNVYNIYATYSNEGSS